MLDLLANCQLCPRSCGVDRTAGQLGACGRDSRLFLARAALHAWEEPCISGTNGSGTVFFSGCNLRCIYCQNYQISKGQAGVEISVDRLCDIFLELQDKKAENINLVTPTHYLPQIGTALSQAKKRGLRIPVVYNTSGYELAKTVRSLEGFVDIWLTDFKYKSSEASLRYSGAADYFLFASAALKEMVSQAGKPVLNERGLMKKGVIVRHLMLPGLLSDTKDILEYLYEEYGDMIYISLMSQYTPVQAFTEYKELNRRITQQEYEEAVSYALMLGIKNCYIQEGESAQQSFIPPFNAEGVLPVEKRN